MSVFLISGIFILIILVQKYYKYQLLAVLCKNPTYNPDNGLVMIVVSTCKHFQQISLMNVNFSGDKTNDNTLKIG